MFSSISIGYAAEHIVATDLILRGIEPNFPAVHSSFYDIVAVSNTEVYKIQVKGGRFDGNVFRADLRKPRAKNRTYEEFEVDMFALVDIDTMQVAYLKRSEIKGRNYINLYREIPDNLVGFYSRDRIILFRDCEFDGLKNVYYADEVRKERATAES